MSSIRDVAELAGVSLSTASIVINGKSKERKISENTQKKVLEAMRKVNYIPNVSAKILRKGESQKYIIALFWNFDFRGIMMNRFLFGLQKRIVDENANVNIVVHPYQTGELAKEELSFISGEFHAAIIANANGNDLEFLENSIFSMPIILYNRLLEGYCSVNVDDRKIGIMAANHLYEEGYRCPAVIHGTKNFPGATHREEAFFGRMQELGVKLPKKKTILAENSIKGGFICGELLIKKDIKQLPDSFFCSSDAIALGMLNALAGKDLIPKRFGIIAIGNSDPQFSIYSYPSLTAINIPIEKMAAECYSFLQDNMYNSKVIKESHYLEPDLYIRESTNKNNKERRGCRTND